MTPTLLFRFTDAYSMQPFFDQIPVNTVDCTHLYGVDCYCSDESEVTLSEMLQTFPPSGIHFLDSGNYHYLTKFWMDKIQEPFSLVLFDNHTDMQETGLFDMLSCGSWVKHALENHPFLKDVLVIGTSKDSFLQDVSQIHPCASPEVPEKTVHCIDRERFQTEGIETLHQWLHTSSSVPIYLSVDKDILSPRDAVTNWDQGTVSLEELLVWIHTLLKEKNCIGADICGEYGNDLDIHSIASASHINNTANEALYHCILPYLNFECF